MNDLTNCIRWSLITNKRQYIRDFTSIFVGTLVGMAFCTGMVTGYKDIEPNNSIYYIMESVGWFVTLILGLTIAGLLSQICMDLHTKQQRTQYFMLPVSLRTKFWVRILCALFRSFIVVPLAIIAADMVLMLASTILLGDSASLTAAMARHLGDGMEIDDITFTIFAFSTFILGGFYFRKVPMLCTTLGWISGWAVIMVLMGYLMYLYSQGNTLISTLFSPDNISYDTMIAIHACIYLALTVLCLWLSYRIFLKMNINPGKYLNN